MLPVLSDFMFDMWWKAKIINWKSFRHWIIWSNSYTLAFEYDDRDTTFVVNILHPVSVIKHKNIIPSAVRRSGPQLQVAVYSITVFPFSDIAPVFLLPTNTWIHMVHSRT